MLRKFIEGLVFGAGFFAALMVLGFFAVPILISRSEVPDSTALITSQAINHEQKQEQPPFHELTVEEQIERSSVIVLARYESGADGKMSVVMKEFLKRDSGTTFYYDLGDEYAASSHFVNEHTRPGDGLVMFFTGSPATMKRSMTYSGDRIHALGDMPMELFRSKCGK